MKVKELKKYTKRNLFTRQCIGDALIALMQEKPFDEITTSDICKKAGISRMTYYHYFYTKTDALNNYIQEIIKQFVGTINEPVSMEYLCRYDVILNAVLFFDRYSSFSLMLCKTGQHHIFANAINEFFRDYVAPNYDGSIFDLYFYSGALMNIFLNWEGDGKKESAEDIAAIIYRMIGQEVRDGRISDK